MRQLIETWHRQKVPAREMAARLGSAAAVADVPLTAVAIGAAIISGGAYAVYDCFQGHSSPASQKQPENKQETGEAP